MTLSEFCQELDNEPDLEYVSFELQRPDGGGVHESQQCGHVVIALGGQDQLLYDAEGLLPAVWVLNHSVDTAGSPTLPEHIC